MNGYQSSYSVCDNDYYSEDYYYSANDRDDDYDHEDPDEAFDRQKYEEYFGED